VIRQILGGSGGVFERIGYYEIRKKGSKEGGYVFETFFLEVLCTASVEIVTLK
jgi:hypothetical protein